MTNEDVLREIADTVEQLNIKKTVQLTREALDKGGDANEIVVKGLQAGIMRVGDKFERGECFVPEMMRAAKAVESAVELIKPHLKKDVKREEEIRMVLGTVKDDIHHIGKNIVKLVLESSGVRVFDLGVNVDSEKFIEEAKRVEAKVIGISALMTTTLARMKEIIEIAKEQGVRDQFRFIIGGAPSDETYAKSIGADAYGKDAAMAVRLVKELGSKK